MRKSEFDSRKLPPKPDYLINQPKTGLTSYQLRKLIIVEAARRAGRGAIPNISRYLRKHGVSLASLGRGATVAAVVALPILYLQK